MTVKFSGDDERNYIKCHLAISFILDTTTFIPAFSLLNGIYKSYFIYNECQKGFSVCTETLPSNGKDQTFLFTTNMRPAIALGQLSMMLLLVTSPYAKITFSLIAATFNLAWNTLNENRILFNNPITVTYR